MTLVIEDARRLINRRVRVVLGDGLETTAPLRGVSSTGTVILLDVKNLREVRLKGVESIEWAPFRCSSCNDEVDTIHGDDKICASCYRRRAANERSKFRPIICEKCGGSNAYRNPADRAPAILCTSCHIEQGTLPRDFSIITKVQEAACRAADIDDPLHAWRQIKSSRWVCLKCQIHRYQPPVTW